MISCDVSCRNKVVVISRDWRTKKYIQPYCIVKKKQLRPLLLTILFLSILPQVAKKNNMKVNTSEEKSSIVCLSSSWQRIDFVIVTACDLIIHPKKRINLLNVKQKGSWFKTCWDILQKLSPPHSVHHTRAVARRRGPDLSGEVTAEE